MAFLYTTLILGLITGYIYTIFKCFESGILALELLGTVMGLVLIMAVMAVSSLGRSETESLPTPKKKGLLFLCIGLLIGISLND